MIIINCFKRFLHQALFPLTVAVIVAAALASAGCQGDPHDAADPPLNSARIRAEFGSYGVTVIRQDPALRYACLYSDEAGGRVCRTLAIVAYADDEAEALKEPMRDVRAGASLGETLVAAGWSVTKLNRHIGDYDFDPGATPAMAGWLWLDVPDELALHIYELRAGRADRTLPVAEILELHHPDYLTVADLRHLYGQLPELGITEQRLAWWRSRLIQVPDSNSMQPH